MSVLLVTLLLVASAFEFQTTYVDVQYGGNGRPGWVRAADMDGDGDVDLVAGGGSALFVYENDGSSGGWVRSRQLDGTGKIGANGGLLLDVDRDGDPDVVSAQFYDDIGWWENPCGESCTFASMTAATWPFHRLGEVGSNGSYGPHYYLHDIAVVDFGGGTPGSPQILTPAISRSCGSIAIKWFEPGPDPTLPWTGYVIEDGRSASSDGSCNHAGIDSGRVDDDGRRDVLFSNGWYESPAEPRATWPATSWHPFTSYDNISNALLRDLSGDGVPDVVTSSGHANGTREVRWYLNPGGDASGTWTHTTIGALRSPECLQALDLDGDRDLEVVSCDLDFSRWDQEIHNVYVFENPGDASPWTRHNVAPNTYPSHKLQVVDVNRDGRVDIISESAGFSVVSFHENLTVIASPPAPQGLRIGAR